MGRERKGRLRHGAVLLTAGALAAVVLGACSGGGERRVPEPPASAPGPGRCGPDALEPLDPRSTQHLLPGSPPPSYAGDPPTSGPHAVGATPRGALDRPLPEPVQVALLEEGVVLVQHHSVTADDRRRLEALAGDAVVVAPRAGPGPPVVATAWRHRMVCAGVDLAALRAFIASRRGAAAAPHPGEGAPTGR